ncbi:MAG: diguanylate cyclase, partial [bacterium]
QKKEGFKAAQAQVLKDQDKLAMDDIRKKLLEMKNEEQALLAERSQRTSFGVQLATAVFLFGVLIALGVIGFSVLVINRDLSERKKAEDRLAQSELRFRSIFEKSGIGIALTDMQGRIIQSNPSLQELLGYSGEELEQKSCEEFVHPADQHADTGVFREIAAGKRESFTQEKRIVRKNGELFWGRVTVAPIRGESGSPVFSVRMVEDITLSKQTEERLRESKRFLQDTLDALSAHIAILDKTGKIVAVNAAWRNFADASNFAATSYGIGDNYLEICERATGEGAKEAHEVAEGIREVLLNQKEEYYLEYPCHSPTEKHWFALRVTRFAAEGPQRLVVAHEDITDRKLAQEELYETNIKLSQTIKTMEEHTREITLVNEMGELFQSSHSVEEASSIVARFSKQLFEDSSGALFVIHSSRNLVEAVSEWGELPAEERVFAPDECWALRRGKFHFYQEGGTGLPCPHVKKKFAAYSLCVPMVAQGEAIGVFHLRRDRSGRQSKQAGTALPEEKQRLAVGLSEQIGMALANLRLSETLRDLSIRDALTGLFNRRYMAETIDREVRRASRSDGMLGVIMLDLDNFKMFNDTFGHDAGDELLRELGTFLRNNIRGEDVPCRYGGEEFLLILPGASLEVSTQRAEKLREGIKHVHAKHAGQSLGNITLSLGVAVFPAHGSNPQEVIQAADAALYRAKKEGRDRVVIAKPA